VDKSGLAGESTGEYKMQEGFGWTNGIILEFLHKYRFTVSTVNWNITSQTDSSTEYDTNSYNILVAWDYFIIL